MKNSLNPVAAAIFFALSFNTLAAGVGKSELDVTNSKLTNTGKITATSQSFGGASQATAGLVANAPTLAYSSKVVVDNSQLINSGEITATSQAFGGTSSSVAGLIANQ